MPRQHWFFRYKIYHIPFWFLYHYLWWVVTIGDPVHAANNIFNSYYSFKYCFYVIFQAVGVYFNLYYLIPKFLEKGHNTKYIVLLSITIVTCALLIVTGYYFAAWLSPQSFEEMFYQDPSNWQFFFQVNTLPSTAAAMTLGMSLKFFKNWIESRRREQALEKEKMEAELKFLKSQFNPHFLFNTINSIFVLINKDPNMATDALAKFSDILRYQLYECNEQQIPLRQELDYISNYIELQKLRHDKDQTSLDVLTNVGFTSDYVIAPFILMPFIENAFKHVSKKSDQPNWIKMSFQLKDGELVFNIANSISPIAQSSMGVIHHGGLGLKNVRRRLELLYSQNHELDIVDHEDVYSVTLKLVLQPRMPITTEQRTLTA